MLAMMRAAVAAWAGLVACAVADASLLALLNEDVGLRSFASLPAMPWLYWQVAEAWTPQVRPYV